MKGGGGSLARGKETPQVPLVGGGRMHRPRGLDCAKRRAEWDVAVQPGMGWRGRDEREGP